MDCQRVSELLEQYFDGELSSELTIELEASLEGCEHCQEELAFLTQTRDAIREPVLKELQEVSFDGMWARIQSEIQEESLEQVTERPAQDTPVGWFQALKELFAARPFIPVGMGAIAAAALLLILLPPMGDHSSGPPTPGGDSGSVAGNSGDGGENGSVVKNNPSETPDGPDGNNMMPDNAVSNLAFVSGVQYETGSIFIDQDPDDSEAPLIVWHLQDESNSDREGG